jgi:translation initiation factor 2 beta subunit (eIF-2beta)/eIF-5
LSKGERKLIKARSDIMKNIVRTKGNYKYDECGREKVGTDVNRSDVMSYLIKEVGTKVTHYQSDLYYDLHMMNEDIDNWKPNEIMEDIYIGLRDSGVDGSLFVLSGASNSSTAREFVDRYIALYKVSLREVEDETYKWNNIILSLDLLEEGDMISMWQLVKEVKDNF